MRPIPLTLTVADLASDYLWARCPNGHNSRQMNAAFLALRYPPDQRLVDVVARMVCRQCGARAVGEIEECPRSGAEGYRQRVSASSSPPASPAPAQPGPAPRTAP